MGIVNLSSGAITQDAQQEYFKFSPNTIQEYSNLLYKDHMLIILRGKFAGQSGGSQCKDFNLIWPPGRDLSAHEVRHQPNI
jgi:hypothetical protein